MATRLNYSLPIIRRFLLDSGRRLRPGGLAATLPQASGGRPLVMVVGPGRSGSSTVARVLHESGLRIGRAFDPPSGHNRRGFYEDIAFRAMNDRLVAELGLSDVGRFTRWPWRSSVLGVAERYRSEMQALAADVTDGWKDPRLAITLEAWLEHLPRWPKVVICLRSPESFLHSVTQIYGLVDRRAVEHWWARGLRRTLDVVRDYRLEATSVEYDELVRHPEETVAALAEFVGHRLDARHVEPELRQFSFAVPRRHAALYQEVSALGGHATARAVGSGGEADNARGIEQYRERVRAIDARVEAAKAEWTGLVGTPPFTLAPSSGADAAPTRAIERTRQACEPFVAALGKAQADLGVMLPPDHFERYHELTRDYVNGERLVAQLMLNAAGGAPPDRRALDGIARAWRLFSSPDAVAKSRARREQAYARAVKALGYSGAGGG